MKHLIEEHLNELKIQTNSSKTELLLTYLEELILWNKKMNLISRKLKKEEVLKKLLLPSLAPYKIINENEKILDFGAGGGIASIPLKILKPEIILHLLESKTKPVVFLEHIGPLLNLEIKIINKFVRKKEDLEETYDWIFVRAVNPEQIPQGLTSKILYYGKYKGDKFTRKKEISVKGNIISVLA